MYQKECKWCKEIIIVKKQPNFASHVASCKYNPTLEQRKLNASKKFKGIFKAKRFTVIKKCVNLKCDNVFEEIGSKAHFEGKKVKKYCSRKCANIHIISDLTKEKISDGVKNSETYKLNSKLAYDKKKKVGFKKDILHEFTCLYCKEKGLNKHKNKKYHKECWLKISGGIRVGSGRGKSGWYKGYWCDSSWELAYVIYNLDHNIEFERNKEGFEYEYNNEKHKYYPDFILEDGTYVEIKGYKSEITNAKIKYFPHKIKLIYKENIKYYLNYVIEKYGNKFIKQYET